MKPKQFKWALLGGAALLVFAGVVGATAGRISDLLELRSPNPPEATADQAQEKVAPRLSPAEAQWYALKEQRDRRLKEEALKKPRPPIDPQAPALTEREYHPK